MTANPQGFFRFAAWSYSMLRDFSHRKQGRTGAGLASLIRALPVASDSSRENVIEQLLTFNFIEPPPDASVPFSGKNTNSLLPKRLGLA